MRSRRLCIVGAGMVAAALTLPAAAGACTIPGTEDSSFDGPVQNFDGTFPASLQGSYVAPRRGPERDDRDPRSLLLRPGHARRRRL
jgi:hypothetical protein